MLTKGFHSGFSCYMAKSQYTDSIAGEVLVDIRTVNDKIINFGSIVHKALHPNYKNTFSSHSSTKYSQKGISLNKKGPWFLYNNYPNLQKFTLSWWQNIQVYNNSWTGISIENTTARYHFCVEDTSGGAIVSAINIMDTINLTSLSFVKNTSIPSNNTWYHYAVTFDGTSYKMYRNGSLLITDNYSIAIGNMYYICVQATKDDVIFDDICLIKDQVLWTCNFTPPDYLLTGDKTIPKKLQSRMLYYPARYGDYFDKAFIY